MNSAKKAGSLRCCLVARLWVAPLAVDAVTALGMSKRNPAGLGGTEGSAALGVLESRQNIGMTRS